MDKGQYNNFNVRFSYAQAKTCADEIITDPNMTARMQAYLGKLLSEQEREIVHDIFITLRRWQVASSFWHRLQTAGLLRQRYCHFRASLLQTISEEREQANSERKRRKTAVELLQEHKTEILELSAAGRTSAEIAIYLRRRYRWQFKSKGSPHKKPYKPPCGAGGLIHLLPQNSQK